MARGILKKRLSKLVRKPRNLGKRLAEPLRRAMRPPDYGTLQKRIWRLEQDLHNLRWQEYAQLSNMRDQRTLLRVTWDSASDADELFSTLMGENVERRRAYIEEHALEVKNLDV